MKKTRRRDLEEAFIVKFDDETKERIWISIGTQLTGESAVSVAQRQQELGKLPPGSIIAVVPEHDRSKTPEYRDPKLSER